jgi:hypothetical protein
MQRLIFLNILQQKNTPSITTDCAKIYDIVKAGSLEVNTRLKGLFNVIYAFKLHTHLIFCGSSYQKTDQPTPSGLSE